MKFLTRMTAIDALSRWATGNLSAQHVHEMAEDWLATYSGGFDLPREDPESIIVEIIVQLDLLNQQLITPQDIPVLQDFLATLPGQELQGWSQYHLYWSALDMSERRAQLKSNSYYNC